MIVILVLDHFRCHVLQGSTESISLLHMVRLYTPPKIANLDDVSILDQYVLRLDISMDETLFVHIVDSTADLNEKVEGSIFAQKLFFPYQIKQVSFTGIFQS